MNHELWCCSLRIGMMKKMVNGLPQPFQIPSTRDRGSKRFAWPVTSFEFYLCECNAIVFKEAIFWWQKIKNPNYQGKWKAPKIDNPGDTLLSFSQMILICWGNFFFYCISLVQCMKNNLTFVIDYKDDPDLYVFPDLKYVAIELWQVISSRLIYVWHFFFIITGISQLFKTHLCIRWSRELCLTMFWSAMIRNMQRSSLKKHGGNRKMYGCELPLDFQINVVYPLGFRK